MLTKNLSLVLALSMASVLAACDKGRPGPQPGKELSMERSSDSANHVVTHPLDSDDAAVMAAARTMLKPMKGMARGIEARQPFDTLMENVQPRNDVTFEAGTV